MGELDKSWPRVVSVWWCIWWRSMLGALFFGFLVAFGIGFATDLWELELDPMLVLAAIVLPGVIWSLLVVRLAMRKQYRQFRIAVVPLLH